MKTVIKILVVEDSHWYSDILVAELKRYGNESPVKERFRLEIHNFHDGKDVISSLKSPGIVNNYSIAYLDYYLGQEINASHIIKLIRERSPETVIVLCSQSKNVLEKVNSKMYDFFVYKDESAPAFCRLCLEQYLDNRFFLPLT